MDIDYYLKGLSMEEIARCQNISVLALSNLHDRYLSGYFWIGALDVDQLVLGQDHHETRGLNGDPRLNENEHSEEVVVMLKVFLVAAAVHVWLGKVYPDMQKINYIVHDLKSQQNQEQK